MKIKSKNISKSICNKCKGCKEKNNFNNVLVTRCPDYVKASVRDE